MRFATIFMTHSFLEGKSEKSKMLQKSEIRVIFHSMKFIDKNAVATTNIRDLLRID